MDVKVYWRNIFKHKDNTPILYDRVLFWLTLGLLAIGFIMVTSASMPICQRLTNDPFLLTKRYGLYLIISFFLALFTLCLPIKFWQHYSTVMLITSIIMLLIIPVIGISVNGASRWIIFGSLHIQPAEFSKLSLICYLSSYLVRRINEVRNSLIGFLKPIGITLFLTILLLIQPDLGTAGLLFFTTLAILFLAGAKLWQFIIISIIMFFSLILLILAKPYRVSRIISFWNPWIDPFGSGYQLTQSLMAFGNGKFIGQGLGNSIQKLEYLPEAYTDFIFSIIGEELGYFGVVLILLMIFSIALRAMLIGRKALEINSYFSGFLSCSIGIWFSLQTSINIGTVTGILPIKGLTLPLISYGGSSMLTMLTTIMILLRIDYEIRLKKAQAFILRDM